jgi:hypothetical protein
LSNTVSSKATPAPAERPFFKRRAVIVAAVVIVVAAVTVVTDLPQHQTRAEQISADTAIMKQVNSDLASCAYAANESFTIWNDQEAHTLSPSDVSRVPGLLRDDQTACSFTSESIFDLTSNIEVPQTSAGKPLGALVGTVTLWATSDALSAIESIQTLTSDPGNSSALKQLQKEEPILASDRAHAEAQLEAADKILVTRLPGLNLPVLPDPSRS